MLVVVFSFLALVITSSVTADAPPITDELRALIEAWAPLVWIHPEDPFFPSSIEFHFEHVELRNSDESVVQSFVNRSSLMTGDETGGMHLNTVPDLECADCLQDLFFGERVENGGVPCYAYVKDWQDACETVDVSYRFFYPYNFGKYICIGIPINGSCDGYVQSFGNHVGDWEHFAIRIRGGEVIRAYSAVHDFGAHYQWNSETNNFFFTEGEPGTFGSEIPYGETIEVVEGFHSEVFSANGSHGTWTKEGTHVYMKLPLHLEDHTARGVAWRTWENLEIVGVDDNTEWSGDLQYLGYRGIWGNLKRGCEVEPVSGECILVNAPALGNGMPGDFPDDCQKTYF
ncbi:unnamed protein product [Meganyctiphanes norvegica]|uniref:Vacuolar protein sorting-associated protein 62 n=1 Tax=Meganyctiphanes norvegica TaxID=48144 RepID=A0AAV2PS12_MEGNR